ncbi:MAG: UDP-glucose/GDP-mannose dehydrogenase family protein [Candidatus Bathyarchaeota archaeon]|nr:UDP-glucose/GDP-mannose dehydrogenase family protein [Candidatus Bathyarchaeota archaeon]
MNIAVLGMGYVGLAGGMAFAKQGHNTICTTTTPLKAENLNNGIPPFFEPGLDQLVKDMVDIGRLRGSTNNVDVVKRSDVTFICVGTPPQADGSADLSAIEEVSKDIGVALRNKQSYHVIVAKSTIPPGTTDGIILPTIEKYSGKKVGDDFGLCMNPEFLRQGDAVHDSLNPDRIVIGEYDSRSGDVLEEIYSDYDCSIMRCDIKAAELIKYAANSLLATKISFANEFSRICEVFNIDVYEVMQGVGLDFRINPRFLNAGCGFGGSCFPKDVNAIVALAHSIDVETPLLDAVLLNNEMQPMHFVDIIEKAVGDVEGKVVAFLGLSFKPNTGDVRETRALPLIKMLHDKGARIKAYDPKAIENFKRLTEVPVEYYERWEDALMGSDFAVIQSDWNEIKEITPEEYQKLMKNPIIMDGRRTYEPNTMIGKDVEYYGIGWKNRDNR